MLSSLTPKCTDGGAEWGPTLGTPHLLPGKLVSMPKAWDSPNGCRHIMPCCKTQQQLSVPQKLKLGLFFCSIEMSSSCGLCLLVSLANSSSSVVAQPIWDYLWFLFTLWSLGRLDCSLTNSFCCTKYQIIFTNAFLVILPPTQGHLLSYFLTTHSCF